MSHKASASAAWVEYYFATNLQGDVIAIYSAGKTLVAKYTYDPWGKVLSVTNASGSVITDAKHIANLNPIRYRGYYYDTESKFYYLQSRYYDPEIKRFINADEYASTGQGFIGHNMFAYCGNNPVNHCDLSGYSYSRVEIHNFVLDDICEKHPTMTHHGTYMKYKKSVLGRTYGFCDMYDTETGEVWEAKRYGGGITCSKVAASLQLANYVKNGVLQKAPDLKLKTGGTITPIDPNAFVKPDNDGDGAYLIGYWDAGGGIIYYDYAYIPSLKEAVGVLSEVAIIAISVGLIFFSGGAIQLGYA